VSGQYLLRRCGWYPALWTIWLVLLSVPCTSASDYEVGESYTGFKFGLIGSGSIDLDKHTIDQRSGLSAGFFFDQPFSSRLHYSISVDVHKMTWREQLPTYRWDESEWLLDLGVNLKRNLLHENSTVGLRPGIGAGVAFLGKMETAGVAGSSYVTLRAFTELVFMSSSDLMGLIEIGIWYAPSGGDNNSDLSLGPLWLLRGGVMF
jgi:hypothetical protein